MDLRWRQGFVLYTQQVKSLHPSRVDKLEKEEACRVYRNFSAVDDGRSRELVAVFQKPQDAALAVKLHNNALEVSGMMKGQQE